MTFQDIGAITGYHAHVYYGTETKDVAGEVRDAIEQRFDVELGRWHDNPIGPHPMGSYQIAFSPALFPDLIPWLTLNRRGLIVFVHPETGQDLEDHRDRALWLGESQPLKLEIFK